MTVSCSYQCSEMAFSFQWQLKAIAFLSLKEITFFMGAVEFHKECLTNSLTVK